MRDAMDAQIWVENHDQFSEWLDGRVHALGRAARHVAGKLPQTAAHGVLMVAAVAATLVSFSAALAPIATA